MVPNLVKTVAWRLWCYFLLAALTTNGILHFVFAGLLLPLKLFSTKIYREAISWQLFFTLPGFLCVPFSWAGCEIYVSSLDRLKSVRGQDQLLLANHSGRIDWLYGSLIGSYYGQRVGYVTEAFIRYLPFLGWHRWLAEDIFVERSFKQDKDRIDANIKTFKDDGVPRWVFLCPEGHIADFNSADKKYIADCEQFCRDQGVEPFKMALTPRYKGMQCFSKLLPEVGPGKPKVCVSATMTYVQNGERLVKPLKSSERVIPDLWSVVNMDLKCYVHLHHFELGSEPSEVKKQLMKDYELKDKLLQEFYETGRFPPAFPGKSIEDSPDLWKPKPDYDIPLKPKSLTSNGLKKRLKSINSNSPESEKLFLKEHEEEDGALDYFQKLPSQHLKMNTSFFAQLFVGYMISELFGVTQIIIPFFGWFFVLMAVCHVVGEMLANGQSRESLPFEGFLKALLLRYYGVEGANSKEHVIKKEGERNTPVSQQEEPVLVS